MPFPPSICYFCGQPPMGEYVIHVGPGPKPPATWTMLYLCAAHHGILAEVGQRGRRYRDYPYRYWLSSREV